MTANVETFNGTTPIRNWLRQFEALATANDWPRNTWHAKLPLFLRGPPASWFALQTQRTADAGDDPYTTLREDLINEFEDPDSFYEAMIQRRQEPDEGVQSYVYDKVYLCTTYDSAMPRHELIRHLKTGLQPELRRALIGRQFTSYEDLLKAAVAIERDERTFTLHKSSPLRAKSPQQRTTDDLLRSLITKVETLTVNPPRRNETEQ